MKNIFGILLCLLWMNSIAQNNPALRSRGKLPANVTGTQQQHYKYEKQKRISRGEVISPEQDKIIYNTSFQTEFLAKSGRLLVNDTMSSYANRVLDVLLKDDPKLRKQMQVFVFYSCTDNVNTYSNGMILIEMGLFARLHTEGELAFILSHEISHYKQNDFLLSFRYELKLERLGSKTKEDILWFSRKREYAADSAGFELFKKSGYSQKDVESAFDLLANFRQEPLQEEFQPTFFEHGRYEFPIEYYLAELVTPNITDSAEEKSTHPATEKRRNIIIPLLDSKHFDDPHFIVSEAAFRYLNRLAIEEYCYELLTIEDYGNAVYMGFAMLKKDSTDLFARKIIGQALYNLTVRRLDPEPYYLPKFCIVHPDEENIFPNNNDDEKLKIAEYDKASGESQRMLYFLKSLSDAEMAVLAFDWNWSLFSQYNITDEKQEKRCDNLLFLLDEKFQLVEKKLVKSTFVTEQDSVSADTIAKADSTKKMVSPVAKLSAHYLRYASKNPDFKSLEKDYEKLKSEESFSSSLAEWNYMAFEKYYDNETFKHKLKLAIARDLPEEKTGYEVYTNSQRQEFMTYGLGIDSICIASSYFLQYTEYKRTMNFELDEAQTIGRQKQINDQIIASGRANRMKVIVLSPANMDSLSTNDYITYCMLMQWMDERFNYGTNPLPLMSAHETFGDSLAARLGTPYIMVNSVVSMHIHRVRNVALYVASFLFPYTIPISIIYGLVPKNRSQCKVSVLNLKTGEQEMYYEQHSNKKAGPATVNTYFSKVFRRIYRKPAQ